MINIYTDGGCTNNPDHVNYKHGGWAIVVVKDDQLIDFDHGDIQDTTSNRMELVGIIKALRWCRDNNQTAVIYTDSKYCVKGYNQWVDRWKERLWHTSLGTDVANVELWKVIQSLKSSLSAVRVEWCRGHNGNQWNELADQLTWDAREKNK